MKKVTKVFVALTCWTSMPIFALMAVIYCMASNFIKRLSTPSPRYTRPTLRVIRSNHSSERRPAEWNPPIDPWRPYTKHHPCYQPYSN